MSLTIGSLFSGYGGLDIAVSAVLGGRLAWYAEIESAACRVLEAHHPDVPNIGDVSKVDWSQVEPVDILTGGYPCQPFSNAGQRKGTEDERHLWPYVRDAICAIRPRLVILENVRGHLTLGFDSVLSDLADMGMSARWGVVRASDAGAPHSRARLFIAASFHPGHDARGSELWQQSEIASVGTAESGAVMPAPDTAQPHERSQYGSTARNGAAQRLQVSTRGDGSDAPDTRSGSLTGTSSDGDGLSVTAERRDESHADTHGAGIEASDDGRSGSGDKGRREPVECRGSTPTDTRRQRHGSREGSAGVGGVGGASEVIGRQASTSRQEPRAGDAEDAADATSGDGKPAAGRLHSEPADRDRGESDADWADYGPAIARWEHIIGRPAPAPTVRRAERDRLNPVFVEWMMGLPEGHVTGHGLSPSQELKMLGNGVVPQQAILALSHLL